MVRFLRENAFASVLLLLARLYVGWQWLKAGWGKVTGDFDATGFLKGAINKSVTIPADPVAGTPEVKATVAGWWGSFLEGVALPNSGLFSFLVAGENCWLAWDSFLDVLQPQQYSLVW